MIFKCPESNVYYNNLKKDWCKPNFKTKEENKIRYKNNRNFLKIILTGINSDECINDGQNNCLIYK
jgi:hypothetical protein